MRPQTQPRPARMARFRTPLAAAAIASALVTALPAAAQQDQTAALPPADAPAAQTAGQGNGTTAGVVSALDLVGRPVVGATGARVAIVHDMIFSKADGRVRAALAPLGGSGLVSAPTEALRLRPDGSLVINADRAGVAALPALNAPQLAGAADGSLMVPPRPVTLTPGSR